jgi:hypothetical protein
MAETAGNAPLMKFSEEMCPLKCLPSPRITSQYSYSMTSRFPDVQKSQGSTDHTATYKDGSK